MTRPNQPPFTEHERQSLILHTMPDDVRAILVALAEMAERYDRMSAASGYVHITIETAQSAREILSREHKG